MLQLKQQDEAHCLHYQCLNVRKCSQELVLVLQSELQCFYQTESLTGTFKNVF